MTKRNPGLNIVLSILTCGIWSFIWLYQIISDLKYHLPEEDINPGKEIILCLITCGIYTIYLHYKLGKLAWKAGNIHNVSIEDNSILYLILSLFGIGIVNFAIIQSDINKLC